MASRRIFDIIFKTKGLDTAKSQTNQLDSSFNNLASAAKTAAIGFASMQTAMKALEMAKLAATSDNVTKSFNNLAKEPDKMLQSMKKATAGTISEMTLMQKHNEAALLGLPLDRFDEMLDIARGAAQATGQSMDFMLQSVVVALGRQSKLMLDNLGIMIDTEKAYENYAASLETTVDKLTDQEKKQAFVNEALKLGNENLQKIGGTSVSAVDSFGQLTASVENLQVSLGQELLPIVIPLVDKLKDLVDNLDVKHISAYGQSIAIVTGAFALYKIGVMGAVTATKLWRISLIKTGIGALGVGLGEAIAMLDRYNSKLDESKEKQVAMSNVVLQHLNIKKKEKEDNEQLALWADLLNMKATEALELRRSEIGMMEEISTPFLDMINNYKSLAEAQEKEQDNINAFAFAYPKLAKQLGLVTSEQKKQKQALDALGSSFGGISSIASSTSQLMATLAGADKSRQIDALQIAKLAAIANIAQGVTKAFAQGGITGFATGAAVAAAGAAQIATIEAQIASIKKAQFGMDEMLSKPTLILAGEAGPERVQVTPADRPSSRGGGGMTINFLGPVTNKEFIRDTVLPEIQRVQDLGLA